jgi:hypothetical protein
MEQKQLDQLDRIVKLATIRLRSRRYDFVPELVELFLAAGIVFFLKILVEKIIFLIK